MSEAFKKILWLGWGKTHGGRKYKTFAEVKYTSDGKLSIHGTEGPLPSGNALGSSGQINMEVNSMEDLKNFIVEPAPGWTYETLYNFFGVWHRWHLNDLRPNCEHQTGTGWDQSKKLILKHYRLRSEVMDHQRKIKDAAMDSLCGGQAVKMTPGEVEIVSLKYSVVVPGEPYPLPRMIVVIDGKPVDFEGLYALERTEEKTAGWVRPNEHPEGILTKPCEVCGYEFGSAWKKEQVPEDILKFLRELLPSPVTPAWV